MDGRLLKTRTRGRTVGDALTEMGLGVAGLGIAFALGMWLYGRLYVWAIGYDEAADRLYVRTLDLFGDRLASFPVSSITGSDYSPGDLVMYQARVRAPWYYLRVAGRRFPLIIDAQGQFAPAPLTKRLFGRTG